MTTPANDAEFATRWGLGIPTQKMADLDGVSKMTISRRAAALGLPARSSQRGCPRPGQHHEDRVKKPAKPRPVARVDPAVIARMKAEAEVLANVVKDVLRQARIGTRSGMKPNKNRN